MQIDIQNVHTIKSLRLRVPEAAEYGSSIVSAERVENKLFIAVLKAAFSVEYDVNAFWNDFIFDAIPYCNVTIFSPKVESPIHELLSSPPERKLLKTYC